MFDILGLPVDILDKVFNNLDNEINKIDEDINNLEKYISKIDKNKDDIISFMNTERRYLYYYSGHADYLRNMEEEEAFEMIDIVSERLDNLRLDYNFERSFISSIFD